MESPGTPKGHPKSLKIYTIAPQDASKEGLETQSGKSWLPEPPRDLPICLPHGSSTSHKVPPSMPLAPFWLLKCIPFGTIFVIQIDQKIDPEIDLKSSRNRDSHNRSNATPTDVSGPSEPHRALNQTIQEKYQYRPTSD